MNVPLTSLIFLRRQQHFSLNENTFPSYQIHRHWSLTRSKTLHCRTAQRINKTKIDVYVTVKAKALSCWIFENVPNENCSPLT